MKPQLVEEASKAVPNPQILVNMVSRRVRQLTMGHRPLIETTPHMSWSDIALQEILEGKVVLEPEVAESE